MGFASTLLAGRGRAPGADSIRIRGRRRPADDAAFRTQRNVERFRLEMAVRASVSLLVLVFNEIHGTHTGLGADPVIRATAALGVLLNAPYYLLASRTGRWFVPQFYGRMLLDIGLLTAGLYAAAHDEALRLATELQRAARLHAIGEVAAGVAHEVTNALQTVIMPVGLLRDRLPDASPAVKRNFDQIEEGARAAARILRGVLESARLSSEQRQPVRLPDIARRIVELKRYDLRRDRIAVSLDFPGSFPAVLGVPLQFQQVLLNLVTNAQQALGDVAGPRSIAIVGWTEAGRAIVEVRDSGPGIPAAVLPRLFVAFYTTKPNGTGLGLAISAGIVRDHGGDLLAANRPDGGAVLRLSLPALPPDADPAARRPGGLPLSEARTS